MPSDIASQFLGRGGPFKAKMTHLTRHRRATRAVMPRFLGFHDSAAGRLWPYIVDSCIVQEKTLSTSI